LSETGKGVGRTRGKTVAIKADETISSGGNAVAAGTDFGKRGKRRRLRLLRRWRKRGVEQVEGRK